MIFKYRLLKKEIRKLCDNFINVKVNRITDL